MHGVRYDGSANARGETKGTGAVRIRHANSAMHAQPVSVKLPTSGEKSPSCGMATKAVSSSAVPDASAIAPRHSSADTRGRSTGR
jgi:hypothetical protein